MRKLTILICLLIGFVYSGLAKEKVIERPPFIGWNSTIIQIEKIVQTDTATVLHVKAFFTPRNWINIPKVTYLVSDSGERFQIKATDGIPMDEQYFMPESGETSFRLIFPSIPASVSTVDFVEDVDNGWRIWGIQLKEKTLPKLVLPAEAVTHKADKHASLPEPTFKYGTALLKGQILDYKEGMTKELTAMLINPLALTEKEKLTIGSDGTFSVQIPVATATIGAIYIYGQSIKFFLAPGETTSLFINTRELCRKNSKIRKDEKPEGLPVYYGGYMAAITEEYMRHENVSTTDYDKLFKDVVDKDLTGIKDYLWVNYQTSINKIKALDASEACKQLLRLQAESNLAMSLINGRGIYMQSLMNSNKLKPEEANDYYSKLELPEGYYNELGKLTELNTPQVLYDGAYVRLTSIPEFSESYGKTTGIKQGMFFDLVLVSNVLKQISDFTPMTAEQKAQLAALSSPVFLEIAEKKNEKLLVTIEQNKKKTGFTINEAGEVSNEDLFASIISKFAGKAILVDFWATWCGPCIHANKEMAPMKEELKNQEVVYVYIAGDNSPQKTWENMIPDIHGEHFRVSKEQWKYLTDSFNVEGIPTYIVVNRKGDISFKQTGFPGVAKMKEELMKVLAKE